MKASGVAADVIAHIGEDAVGFAGCEIARTAMGLAYERSLRIPGEALKARAEQDAVKVAEACIMGRSGKGPEFMVYELKKFAAEFDGTWFAWLRSRCNCV